MSGRRRRGLWRLLGNLLLMAAVATLVYFAVEGYPLTGGFINLTGVERVVLHRGDESVTLTDAQEIDRALQLVAMLGIRLPQSADSGNVPEMRLGLMDESGNSVVVGINKDTVFLDGKPYGGVKRHCELVLTVLKGLHFSRGTLGE